MKKILLSMSVMVSAVSFAQDTLSQHYAMQSFTAYSLGNVAPADSGYVSGNNYYGDLAKLQLFDASVGVTTGAINGVCMWFFNKKGAGSFQVAVLSDNNGVPNITPAGILGTATATIASIDTSGAGLMGIRNGGPVPVAYNKVVMFASPIPVPAGVKFWVSLVLPTGAGNEVTLVQNNVTSAPYAGSAAHVGEIWSSDGAYHALAETANYGATFQATYAIFPIVKSNVGLDDNSFVTGVYPNPANAELNITSNELLKEINVISLDGKVVATSNTSIVNVSELSAGTYTYQAITVFGKVSYGKFNKN